MADIDSLINQLNAAGNGLPLGGVAPQQPSRIDQLINQLGAGSSGQTSPQAPSMPMPNFPTQQPSAISSLGRGFLDALSAGAQGTSPQVANIRGEPNYQLAPPEEQWAYLEAGVPRDQQKFVALGGKVYYRNPEMAEGPLSGFGRALSLAVPESGIPGVSATTAAVPSAEQLKEAATKGYAAARASPVTVPGADIATAAQGIQQTLLNEHGIIPLTAPKTHAILNQLANPPAGAVGTYPGLEAARRGLSGLTTEGGIEGFAAQKAIPELDKFIDSISPEAATARANYAAAQRSNTLTGDLTRANTGILERAEARAHASHSGTNIDNAIRQRVASFLQNPSNLAGYSQPEIDALNNLVKGGAVQNAARRVGNFLGGGGGLGHLAATLGGAALGGHFLPGTEGTIVGGAIPTAVGVSAKGLENALSKRALANVDEMIRARSPLAQSVQAQRLGLSNAFMRPFAFVPNLQAGSLDFMSGLPPY